MANHSVAITSREGGLLPFPTAPDKAVSEPVGGGRFQRGKAPIGINAIKKTEEEERISSLTVMLSQQISEIGSTQNH